MATPCCFSFKPDQDRQKLRSQLQTKMALFKQRSASERMEMEAASNNRRPSPIAQQQQRANCKEEHHIPCSSAPVLFPESWIECELCKTCRLLPPSVSTAGAKNWTCKMAHWLPDGMNDCKFSEQDTADAVRTHCI